MFQSILRRWARSSAHRKYRINLWLFAGLAVGFVLLVAGVHLLHRVQIKRHAADLKVKAERTFNEDKDRGKAIVYLRQYVNLRPDDPDALGQLAEWCEQRGTAKSLREALVYLDQGVRYNRSRTDLSRRAIGILERLHRFGDALDRLADLRERDAELTAVEARCLSGQQKYDAAAESYLKAIESAPQEARNYEELIGLVERQGERLNLQKLIAFFSPEQPALEEQGAVNTADQASLPPSAPETDEFQPRTRLELVKLDRDKLVAQIIEAMVRSGEPKFRGYMVRAAAEHKAGLYEKAAADIAEARREAPQNSDVLLMATEIELSQSELARLRDDLEEAGRRHEAGVALAREGLLLDHPDLRLFLTLSRLEAEGGSPLEAERYLREGIEEADKLLGHGADKSRPEFRYRDLMILSLANALITRAFTESPPPSAAPPADRAKVLAEVDELKKRLQKSDRRGLVDYLSARVALGGHNWEQAQRLFKRARGVLADSRDMTHSIDLALAECFSRLSQPDEVLRTLEQAVEQDPSWTRGRLGLAEAYAGVGQFDKALEQYNHPLVAKLAGVSAAVSQVLVKKQLTLPEKQRHWDEASRALEAAVQMRPKASGAVLMRADLLLQRKEFAAAEALLAQARDRDPDDVALWSGLVKVALRRTDHDEPQQIRQAEQLLAQARERLGNRVELRFLDVQLAVYRGGPLVAKRLAEIAAECADLPDLDRRRVGRLLAQGYLALGKPQEGLALWDSLAGSGPDDLQDQVLLADLALRAGNNDALRRARQRIDEIEGPEGPNGNYLEAAAVLTTARAKGIRPSDPDLDQARQKLVNVGKDRPSWAAVPRAMGLLEELRGNREEAYLQFRRAFEMGDRSRDTVARVVEYLKLRNRVEDLTDAREIIERTTEDRPELLSGNLARLASQVDAALQDFEEARKKADLVPPGERTWSDLLWQAELEYQKGTRGEPIEELTRRATELAPQAPQAWRARVWLLAQEGKADQARKVIDQAATGLPEKPAYLKATTLGLCYEMLGDRAAAES